MADPEAPKVVADIIDKLPGALEEFQLAQAELRDAGAGLTDIAGQQVTLAREQRAAEARVATDQLTVILRDIPRRLHSIVSYVFGAEELLHEPSLEKVHQLLELDGKLVAAAGQPIVVLKPGKTWIDIGRLKPEDELGPTGLQHSSEFRSNQSTVVLPVYRSVTFDLVSGDEPDWDTRHGDEELRARQALSSRENDDYKTRPRVNPLKTTMLLTPEDGQAISDDPEAAYILVGYTQLQRALNRILGFDPSHHTEGHSATLRFHRANQAQVRLKEAGIDFDMDFIDGYLDYRMAVLKQEIEAGGPLQAMSTSYQQTLYEELALKRARLGAEHWLSETQPSES